jgi:mannose-1-phosphate guanylyltransferase/phosphomannomutase
MRTLIEEKQGEQVELLEGIKVYHDDGWALVLPDADEPVCRVLQRGVFAGNCRFLDGDVRRANQRNHPEGRRQSLGELERI